MILDITISKKFEENYSFIILVSTSLEKLFDSNFAILDKWVPSQIFDRVLNTILNTTQSLRKFSSYGKGFFFFLSTERWQTSLRSTIKTFTSEYSKYLDWHIKEAAVHRYSIKKVFYFNEKNTPTLVCFFQFCKLFHWI